LSIIDILNRQDREKTLMNALPEIDKISRILTPVLKRHGVSSAAVFGSYARGENRADSDLDLLVEFSGPIGLLGVMRVKQELEEAFGGKIDLASPNSLLPEIRARAAREQVRLL